MCLDEPTIWRNTGCVTECYVVLRGFASDEYPALCVEEEGCTFFTEVRCVASVGDTVIAHRTDVVTSVAAQNLMLVRVVANPIGQDGAVTLGYLGVNEHRVAEQNFHFAVEVGMVQTSTRAERNR